MTSFKLHKRSIARIAAVQSLYQIFLVQSPPHQAVTDFYSHFEKDFLESRNKVSYDKNFFTLLVEGVVDSLSTIDPLIEKALPENWAINRLDLVLLCVLRAATFELWRMPETDSAVIINEYLNVTHSFYDDKEPGFVNGILHTLSVRLRTNQP